MDRTVKRGLSVKAKRNIIGYLFIAPALLFFITFVIVPLCIAFYISAFRTNSFMYNMEYVGFANFTRVFNDAIFWKSIVNILLYTVMAVPLIIVVSLLLSMLINSKIKGVKAFRLLYYLPSVTSAVAASVVWLWLMNPSYGLLNRILEGIGLPPGTFLTHSSTSLISVTIVSVWMGTGGNMIIFLAALQNQPTQLYEAARIDGAGPLTIFFKITIPMILPTMYFILTMTLIGAFQLYDQVFVLTDGGPANSTITPVYLIWSNSFGGTSVNQAGYATAQSIVLFLIIMIVTVGVRALDVDPTASRRERRRKTRPVAERG